MSATSSIFVFSTWLGNFQAVYQNGYLKELDLAVQKKARNPDNDFEEKMFYEMREYFAGNLKVFSIPVLPEGTQFQKKVWDVIASVKYGETLSYRELASKINGESYARAVGGAVGKNPVIIIIPCHRIVGTHSLGGYSAGLEIKRELLKLEGISML